MTDQQQPGPSFQPPSPQPPSQPWQGPAGLPPYGQPERSGPQPFIIVVSALLAVALFLGAAVMIARTYFPGSSPEVPISELTTPPNGTEGFGILVNGEEPSSSLPHLIIWEDPRCPACAFYETLYGPIVLDLVKEGRITAEIRFAYFLDRQQPDGASFRGAVAMAAADDVGFFDQYHAVLFQRQAEGEFTDGALTQFAVEAGMEGEALARFQELYQARAYSQFVENSYAKFTAEEILATPTYLVSGKRLRFFDEAANRELISPTTDSFLAAAEAAWDAGGRQIEAPPEPR
ncbi:MAG: thioredoxin domain-containing protein [Propionibacteriaceae bacterium]|nr:thioredoxin domain-containing protein [Propionibacteriaceae bacterium]